MPRTVATFYLVLMLGALGVCLLSSHAGAESPRAMPTQSAAQKAAVVFPGERIGPIAVGMASQDAVVAIGGEVLKSDSEDGIMLTFPSRKLELQLSKGGHPGMDPTHGTTPPGVRAIVSRSPEDRTAEGLGIGSTVAQVQAALGPGNLVNGFLSYDDKGIGFFLTSDRVSAVMVYAPVH